MNKLLWVLLFILLLIVGQKRGLKAFFSFLVSMVLIIAYILLMSLGLNAIVLAFVICILASIISLFFLNGYNEKTKSSFIGVILVQILVFLPIYIISKRASIGAFGPESFDAIGGFNFDINYNMNNVIIGIFLVSIIGTVIDTSISVSTAMNEINENNPTIDEKELFKSGMNVGGDILSTTVNTLYFALVITFIGYFMWHRGQLIEEVINDKLFVKEILQLLIAFIGSIIIIPVTAYISSKIFKKM